MNFTKTRSRRRRFTLLLSNSAAGFVLLFGSPDVWAQPRTLRVPGDFPTIQAAVDNASALVVDTVLVDPGTYNESILVANKEVRIISAGGASVCSLVAPPGTSAVGFSGVGQNTVLFGFTITNCSTAISFGLSGNPTIISNTIVNCGTGIYVNYSSPSIISNQILFCSGLGIWIQGGGDDTANIESNLFQGNHGAIRMNSSGRPNIRNNVIRDTVGDAVLCQNRSEGTIAQNLIMDSTGSGIVTALNCAYGLLVLNNTIVGNGTSAGAGITIAGYGACTRIVNNIVVGNPAITGDGTPPLLQNNNIFSRSGTAYGGTVTNQTGINGNISADPYFACEPTKEFHILAGSPCIDAGTSNGVALPMTDFDGQPRFVNGQTNGAAVVDIGAFEFNPSGPPEPCLFLDCPSDMLVILPAGQETGVVNYPAPYATPVATVTTAPESGSLFPAADNLVSVVAVYGTNSLNCNFLIRLFRTIDFGRALNLTNTDWLTSGDTSWFVQSNITHSGFLALRSGAITNNQTSTLQTTLTGPGTLTFWWKVSSQANRDFLTVKLGNQLQGELSGEVNWRLQTNYIGLGSQVVEWTYAKDASGSSGQDAAWLDQLQLTPGLTAPMIVTQPTSRSQCKGLPTTFFVNAVGTPPLGYQWLLNGTNLPGATASSLSISNVQAPHLGGYSVVVTNPGGTATSILARLTFGNIAAWGENSSGQTLIPPDLTNALAVAGGLRHSVALRSDGTVIAWGANELRQCDVPQGLTNVIAIASHLGNHTLALKADGKVVAWGDNRSFQTNVPASLSNVVAIAAGHRHSMALRANGTVVQWGNASVSFDNLVAVAGGTDRSFYLRADGRLTASPSVPILPSGLTNISAVGPGNRHALALRKDGTVFAWGINPFGQTNVPVGLDGVVAVAAGSNHSIVLRADGIVVGWGELTIGAISVPATPVEGLTNVMAISAGADFDLALLSDTQPLVQAQVRDPHWSDDTFSISLSTQNGFVYRMEYKTSPTDTTWQALDLVPGTWGNQTLIDSTATNSVRTYRIRRW